jgi:GMP synthase-like glutamine amidotransferase
MKPVVIVRYAPHEGPGYFADYLTRSGIAWRLVKLDAGEPLPTAHEAAGLAMMGGAMSVNDALPWVGPMIRLVRESVAAGVPVIGHCLGGQLLAKALGGEVTGNPVKEIGWADVDVLDTPLAREWGPASRFVSFHWHGERFSLPPGATRIWASACCENQAFVLGDHLGMQCHVEMTEEMIEEWCASGTQEIERELRRSPAVQSAAAIRERLGERLRALNRVADSVYGRWIRALRRSC